MTDTHRKSSEVSNRMGRQQIGANVIEILSVNLNF